MDGWGGGFNSEDGRLIETDQTTCLSHEKCRWSGQPNNNSMHARLRNYNYIVIIVCRGRKKKNGVDNLHLERLAQVPQASRVPPGYATGEVLCRVKPP